MKEKTPFEAWYGYKSSLKFLKVFGYLCFTHVPQGKLDKLDRRASPGIFTGYSTISKAYKNFQLQTGKIVMSRDVHFVEDEDFEEEDDWQNEIVDDAFVRGTKLLSDIYERCNVAVYEPANYVEAKKNQRWGAAMEEELSMIKKKKTWILPEGCEKQGEGTKIYLLKKALYSLKQAPRTWYSKIDEHLLSLGFVKSLLETTLYVKHNDLGLMSYFLGIEIKQGQGEVFICQKKYAKEILKKFKMDELTRHDILNDVSISSCFMHCASELHLKAVKRVVRYVKDTSDFGVKFTRGEEFKLIAFSDSDWRGSIDDMRSTLGYYFTLGSALWLRKILLDLDMEHKESTEILVDNKAAIAISHNPLFYKKTKHFNIKLFFLREVEKSGEVILVYCKTEDQVANILTKPLPTCKFEFLRSKLGVCNF
ncbi:retrovirus-related Pol polyprotein from transposon TNT 1-94 [Cucumis melo var. makuwa]|uniref:Retrovirus-related Pol polyprotein from transposon TNT 1-94 n=1 Tax=Cucumis melo var. makuwa TaxID=1194695 RepID=A0A5D3DHR0_CUCMM|nr:retrovirus-related Pol polyprotein from transposon TNT 1-94 [Cucumis melo var. makuwa]